MTRYAIQLTDFMALRQSDPALFLVLAANGEREPITVSTEEFDGEAAALACSPEQAGALVRMIRTKYRSDQVRIWRNDTGASNAWQRV